MIDEILDTIEAYLGEHPDVVDGPVTFKRRFDEVRRTPYLIVMEGKHRYRVDIRRRQDAHSHAFR